MRDENNELPGNFLSELYKWALECKLDEFSPNNLSIWSNQSPGDTKK